MAILALHPMLYILIPVKNLSHAKQRLVGLMTQEERSRLAWTMFDLTLETVVRVRNADRIAVVTNSHPVVEKALSAGVEIISETRQTSESDSVDFGSHLIEQNGATAALRLPIDLPLITTRDIEQIIESAVTAPSTVIVPSRDGTGTNAILRRPATLFPSHFGPGSLAKHLAEADRTGARSVVLNLDRVALDIDDPSDLAELMRHEQPAAIQRLLEELLIEDRLRKLQREIEP